MRITQGVGQVCRKGKLQQVCYRLTATARHARKKRHRVGGGGRGVCETKWRAGRSRRTVFFVKNMMRVDSTSLVLPPIRILVRTAADG